ncbi:hypothetical protein RLOC_00013242 [Lonchura striata]|uniref:Uncharacterized protein n=1 Tax=Lonchura striata TaxID=40157 RepID=A0A218ULH2_9PASE|nr:hypothetical protein RLOC_00013242 [Lonchura striata domestica]
MEFALLLLAEIRSPADSPQPSNHIPLVCHDPDLLPTAWALGRGFKEHVPAHALLSVEMCRGPSGKSTAAGGYYWNTMLSHSN